MNNMNNMNTKKPLLIAFHDNTLNIRGTSVAMYDYAHYNEVLLGNKSIILVPKQADHDELAVHKFSKRFRVLYYTSTDDIDSILSRERVDVFYVIKYGKRDRVLSSVVKTVVHCVFDMSEPHGQVYAAVSDTLASKFNRTCYVPHMIGLQPSLTKENMRVDLGISSDAIVFGRHGGMDCWNLPSTNRAITRVVNDTSNVYFVLVNTPEFYKHPRIIHISKIVDNDEKNRFICTCDAMIHSSSYGETFGLAIGEFSVNNKPIITYGGQVWNDNYKNILGKRGVYYYGEQDCYEILCNFKPSKYVLESTNSYTQYTPVLVMNKFKEVFLD